MKISVIRNCLSSLLFLGLVGCQYAAEPTAPDSSQVPSPEPAKVQPAPLTPCGSGAPRVDRDKIHQRLVADGVITPEMSDAQAEQQVSDYIKQRQQAYKKCLKRNPS